MSSSGSFVPVVPRRSRRAVVEVAAYALGGALFALLVIVLAAHVLAAPRSPADAAAKVASAVVVPSAAPPALPPEEPDPTPPLGAFDWKAARESLDATEPAMQACRRPGGLRGRGLLRVVFGPDGAVHGANAVGDFARTPEGTCVAKQATDARTAPFHGGPRAIIYTFSL